MSRRSHERRRAGLSSKSDALEGLINDAAVVLEPGDATRLESLRERVQARAGLSAEHTVIGFFGATGSGKSSLLNALTGAAIARVAHRRPTTSEALAAIVDDPREGLFDDAHELLDWLEISERHVVDAHAGAPGIIYVDLPDFDSVERANREVAERLAERVDVLVWVSDPEKYADGVLHGEFVQKFAAHDAVTIAVLNQADRLPAHEREQVRANLEELMRADGLPTAKALAVSAVNGDGLEELRAEFVNVAKSKSTVLKRLEADLVSEASGSAAALGASETEGCFVIEGLAKDVPPQATDALEEAIVHAAQVPAIAKAVGTSYRMRASRATGWPLVRWLGSFRADPLARMRIGRATSNSHRQEDTAEEFVARSSLTVDAPMALARMNRGLDEYLDTVVGDAAAPWPARMRHVTEPERERLPDTADWALTHTPIDGMSRSWWWTPLNIVQWLALVAVLVGLGWLLALAGFDFAQIPKPPMPMVEGLWVPIPVPTALIVCGVLLGIAMALLAGFINRMVARRRELKAERQLRVSIRKAVEDSVGKVVGEECVRASRIEEHLGALLSR